MNSSFSEYRSMPSNPEAWARWQERHRPLLLVVGGSGLVWWAVSRSLDPSSKGERAL